MRFLSYPDRDLLMASVADAVASDLTAALRQNERVSLSVPGGTSPGPVFDLLSGVALDWARVTVFANDERWVGPDSGRSNARMIRDRLLRNRAQAADFVPFYGNAPEPEVEMDRLVAAVSPHLPISVLLLGMGADMHTASLFPRADRLAEALAPDAPILVPLRAEAAGEVRVSLSARVLRGAMACHVLITGLDKRAAIEEAERLPPEVAPIKAVLGNATVHWAE